jgi:hypothetical protein
MGENLLVSSARFGHGFPTPDSQSAEHEKPKLRVRGARLVHSPVSSIHPTAASKINASTIKVELCELALVDKGSLMHHRIHSFGHVDSV